MKGIQDAGRRRGHEHRDRAASIGHLDPFATPHAPERLGRILLELTHSDPFHVRQSSTKQTALDRAAVAQVAATAPAGSRLPIHPRAK